MATPIPIQNFLSTSNFHKGLHIVPTPVASIAQLVEHALRKRTVVGSIPTGGF